MFNTVTVTHYLDDTQKPCVCVPLSNVDREVHLWTDDFYRLIQGGLDARWRLENGQILEKGTRLSVTRLVADADKGESVLLADKNPCNLKRSNLVLAKGRSGKNTYQRFLDVDERLKVARHKAKIKYEPINPYWMNEIMKDTNQPPEPTAPIIGYVVGGSKTPTAKTYSLAEMEAIGLSDNTEAKS